MQEWYVAKDTGTRDKTKTVWNEEPQKDGKRL
jgi:hypothetical protein